MKADIVKLDITGRRRWQGVIRIFINRLDDEVRELEMKERLPLVDQLAAKRLQQRLKESNEVFAHLHFAIVDLLEQQKDFEMEQAAFNGP